MLEGLRNLGGNPFFRNQMTLAFTGPRLGTAFFLVCAALTGTLLTFLAESAMYRTQSPAETAAILSFAHHLVMLGLLLVLLPIKASGSIEGPRISGVFDQLVGTGLNPPTLALGAWASGMMFAGMILVVSLPFAVGLTLLADVSPLQIAANYGLLLLYSNVILAVSLAASTLFREYGAVPGTILVLGTCGLLSLIPDRDMWSGYPSIFAELTPARYFFTQNFSPDEFRRLQVDFHASPVLFFWSVPLWLYRLGLWALITAMAMTILKIGPGHRFSQGLNIFGTVTAGGRFAGFLKRLRSGLTRRIEMAFFYENAPGWTARWGFALRSAMVLLPIFAIWATYVGATYLGHPYPIRTDFWRDELALSTVIVTGVPLLFWALWTCEGKGVREIPVAIGHRSIARELFVCLVFAALFALWLGLMWFVRDQLLANAAAGAAPTRNPSGLWTNIFDWDRYKLSTPLTPALLQTYADRSATVIGIVACMLANTFLITRVAARITRFARILAIAGILVLLTGPTFVGGMIRGEFLSPAFEPISYLSPAYTIPEFLLSKESEATLAGRFVVAHLLLMAALLAPILLGALRGLGRRNVAAAAAAVLLCCHVTPAQEPPAGVPAEAQDPPKPGGPLVIEAAHRCFDGFVFGDQIDFFTITIRNDAETPIRGECWFETRRAKIERRPFFLTGRSKKTIRFTTAESGNWWGRESGPVVFRYGDRRVETKELYRVRQPANRGGTSAEQQHLFVGENKLDLPPPLLQTVMANNARNAVVCSPHVLPLDADSYTGLEGVWLTAQTLRSLQPRQRRALHRYALLGGSVVLHGGLPKEDLPDSGPWVEMLAGASSRVFKLDETELRHVQLIEGEDVLHVPSAGGADLPLLNSRPVGLGRVSHIAFFPVQARTPKSLLRSRNFWQTFGRRLPRGTYGIRVSYADHIPQQSNWTSMGVLGIYLGGYTLILTIALVFAGWRRRRSGAGLRRLPLWAIFSLAFSAGVPLVVAAIRSVPTTARYIEFIWFGPNSTRGVVSGQIQLRSGGKRSHDVDFQDETAFTHRMQPGSGFNSFGFIDESRKGFELTQRGRLQLDMPAWSARGLNISAPRQRQAPVAGSALKVSKTVVEVQGTVPAEYRGLPAYCAWFDNKGTLRAAIQPDAEGRFKVRLERLPRKKGARVNRANEFVLPGHNMRLFMPFSQQRVMLVFSSDRPEAGPGLDPTSPDLDFELPLPRPEFRAKFYETLPRLPGGKKALRVRRCIVFELPLR